MTSQLGRRQWKLYVQIQCQFGYLMMLISNGICNYERRYATLNKNICHFWDHHRAQFPEKNSKAGESIPKDAMLRSAFSVERAFWVFYQDSRIRVKRCVPCVFWGFALLKGTRSMIDPTSIKSTHPKISQRMVQNKFFPGNFFAGCLTDSWQELIVFQRTN